VSTAEVDTWHYINKKKNLKKKIRKREEGWLWPTQARESYQQTLKLTTQLQKIPILMGKEEQNGNVNCKGGR
jgi:hypothetical protein